MVSISTKLSLLAFVVAGLILGGPAAWCGEDPRWTAEEAQCHGNLDRMLQVVAESTPQPHFRTNKNVDRLFVDLKAAGRFEELGLSDAEGRILIEAVYAKLKSDVQSNDPAAGQAQSRSESHRGIMGDSRVSYEPATEFERLKGVLMRWPFDWGSMKAEWADMVDALSRAGVTIYMWVNTTAQRDDALSYLNQQGAPVGHIEWVVEKTNSVWIRDYGPQFVYDDNSNAWGVVDFHYANSRPDDDDTPLFISQAAGVPRVNRQTTDVVYTEGGNLNHDGLGCVIYSQRTYSQNSGVNPAVIDQRVLSAFQSHANIVPQDPTLDMTGHVDMFLKIVDEDTILVAEYAPNQKDYQILENCAALMAASTNGNGDPWNVVRIPQPDVYYIFFIIPVVRTYTNSLVANDVVLFTSFGINLDQDAYAIYQQVYPGKTLYAIDASAIIRSGGAWHCVTMEFPNPKNP